MADDPRPGDGLVRAGGVLFVVGVVLAVVNFVPFFFGSTDRPVWVNLGTFAMPLGFGLAIVGVLRAVRASHRTGQEQQAALDRLRRPVGDAPRGGTAESGAPGASRDLDA